MNILSLILSGVTLGFVGLVVWIFFKSYIIELIHKVTISYDRPATLIKPQQPKDVKELLNKIKRLDIASKMLVIQAICGKDVSINLINDGSKAYITDVAWMDYGKTMNARNTQDE